MACAPPPEKPLSSELRIAPASVGATAVEDRAPVEDVPWRIEAPSERTPQQPVTREPGIAPEAGVPIPTWSHDAVPGILRGQIEISLGQVLRTEAAPVVECVLGLIAVETHALNRFVTRQCDLVVTLYLDCLLAIASFVPAAQPLP